MNEWVRKLMLGCCLKAYRKEALLIYKKTKTIYMILLFGIRSLVQRCYGNDIPAWTMSHGTVVYIWLPTCTFTFWQELNYLELMTDNKFINGVSSTIWCRQGFQSHAIIFPWYQWYWIPWQLGSCLVLTLELSSLKVK